MELKDWITLISVIIVIVGWFANSYLNRRHEIFKKRLDYRLKMLDSYVQVAAALVKNSPNFVDLLGEAQVQILLFGTEEEVKKIKVVVEAAKNNNHSDLFNISGQLMQLIRNNLRSELNLKKHHL